MYNTVWYSKQYIADFQWNNDHEFISTDNWVFNLICVTTNKVMFSIWELLFLDEDPSLNRIF